VTYTARESRPRERRGRGALAALVLVGLVLLAGVVVYEVAVLEPGRGVFSVVTAPLQVSPTSTGTLAGDFLGVNVRADDTLGTSEAAAINQTSARLLRWPGGALSDRYDPLGAAGMGLIYNDSGAASAAESSLSGFVSWCRWVGCHAIVTLPVEIDNSSYAAALARYTVTTLGFTPAYWELGNEPARWSHFGVPWKSWTGAQNLTATPTAYAQAAGSYITAVRGVDPSARFLAPGGVGFGGATETSWVGTVVQKLGRELAGLSMHVYPAGNANLFGSTAQFFDTLGGPGGLPSRVAAVRSAASQACGSCALSIVVDEFGAQTGAPVGGISGFPLVPYLGAEALQALQSNVNATAFWLFQSGYPAAWFAPDGTSRPTYALYSVIFASLPSLILPTHLVFSGSGLFAQAFAANGSTRFSLLVVNANATVGVSLNLTPLIAPGGASRIFWDGTTSAPTATTFGNGSIAPDRLPPVSIVRYDGLRIPAAVPAAAAHSENSGIAPGSIVPNVSTVKNCLSAPVAGQMLIQGIARDRPSRGR
jgi:hypothetical protein